MKVEDIMTKDLTSVIESDSIEDLIYLLDRSELSGVPVVDNQGVVIGFISERDVIEAVLPDYFEMLSTAFYMPDLNQLSKELGKIQDNQVSKHMTKEIVSVTKDQEDVQVADLIIRNNLNRIPVVDEADMLVGVVRRIDLVKAFL